MTSTKRGMPLQHLAQAALLLLLSAASLCHSAFGQALPTATKAFGFALYGAASEIEPDYGPQRNYGFVLGADATRRLRFIDVTVEPRFGRTTGPTVGQTYFLGLLKFERALGPGGRIHPYGGAGIGYGSFTYENTGFNDNSTVYAIDGGVDVDVVHNLGVKVDWQYQFWDLGVETNGFNPQGLSAGVFYRINSLPFFHRH